MKCFAPLSLFHSALLAFAGAAILITGCQPPGSGASSETSGPKSAVANEAGSTDVLVPKDASPSEVAKVALQFIQDNNKKGLLQLVAAQKVRQDVKGIAGGRDVAGMVSKAIPMAVAAIAAEINGLEKEGREIGDESIQGETATVTVKGTILNKPQSRRFFLVREDDRWRLVPSHR
ncbi:MAG: hypothetical protein ABL888_02445 [Pirellulaceae bacterium]